MNKIFVIIFKIVKRILMFNYSFFCTSYTWVKLKGNGVEFASFHTKGIPLIDVEIGGRLRIGTKFKVNNGSYYNKIGRPQPSMFVVTKNGFLEIGNNVGISASALICTLKINIGNNVKIGGNCVIYDTDFHSIDYTTRRNNKLDVEKSKSLPVILEDDVFIGAHSTILKGVVIGKGSVIGACSVVSKSIPANEIWAGNPARFVKSIINNNDI